MVYNFCQSIDCLAQVRAQSYFSSTNKDFKHPSLINFPENGPLTYNISRPAEVLQQFRTSARASGPGPGRPPVSCSAPEEQSLVSPAKKARRSWKERKGWVRVRLGQDRIGQDRIGQDRIGQDRIGQNRIGQDRIGQNRIGQDRIGQDRIGQDRLELGLASLRLSSS